VANAGQPVLNSNPTPPIALALVDGRVNTLAISVGTPTMNIRLP
jgi:hypothetical protein